MSLGGSLGTLHTARLTLSGHDRTLGSAVAAFCRRNQVHLAPWEPPAPPGYYTDAFHATRVAKAVDDFMAGTALRWWLCDGGEVLGHVHVSGIVRGAFHSAHLGYALDAARQGQGLMHEALQAVIAEVFSPRANLHRLQAACRPENARSGAVLQRLGFETVGVAKDYLYIDGAWRDHLLTQRCNPAFTPPADWAATASTR